MSAPERKSQGGAGKAGLGCLLVALFGGALVSGLFAVVGLGGIGIEVGGLQPTDDFPGAEDSGVGWYGIVATLLFALPMFALFSRGVVLTIKRLLGRETAPLVSSGWAAMLSLAYGVPGALALIVLLIIAPDRVSPSTFVSGFGGVALLLAAPFVLRRLQKNPEGSK